MSSLTIPLVSSIKTSAQSSSAHEISCDSLKSLPAIPFHIELPIDKSESSVDLLGASTGPQISNGITPDSGCASTGPQISKGIISGSAPTPTSIQANSNLESSTNVLGYSGHPNPHTLTENCVSNEVLVPVQSSTPMNTHQMITRSKSGVVKPRVLSVSLVDSEPNSVDAALKSSHWKATMTDEYAALQRTQTWSLVPHPTDKNVIGCKWVFRIKRNSDGSLQRYKARLVAKGHTQMAGFDYTNTFSPVIKPATIRVILSLAVSYGWSLRQLDFNNAFLNGDLTEDVYMVQPPGFVSSSHPQYVCKLHKSSYGLK